MPAIRAQEAPEALAATVLPPEHGGCLRRAGADIRQSSTATNLALAKSRGPGGKEDSYAAVGSLETWNAVKAPTRASPGG